MNNTLKSDTYVRISLLLLVVMSVSTARVQAEPCYAGEWHKTRLYGHSYNSGDFTDEQYDWIRDNFEYFTIEKTHLRAIYGDPSHELTSRLTATRLIEANPRCKPIMIYSAGGAYPHFCESQAQALIDHPDYFLYNDDGDPASLNLANPDENDWWIDTVNWNCDNSDLYGIFVDSFKSCYLTFPDNVRHMMEGMTGFSLVNGFDFSPNGLTIRDFPDLLEFTDGVFIDNFFRKRCTSADSGVVLIDTCLQVPNDYMIVCWGSADGNTTDYGEWPITHEFTHAAYLIVANDNTYYRWVGEGQHNWNDSSLMNWHEDFGKEIGRPLGPATKDGYAYHRVFEHCTVDINVETKTSSIEWGQNNIFYENVVLNGTATQSSTDYEGVPERAIDGNTNGDYNDDSVTHTAFEDQPWWQVDLGAPYAIDEIQVWGRTDDCCKGRLSNYDVYILDCRNNVVWSNYQASYPDPSVSLDPEWARGRFVTIQLQAANQALSLAEVRVLSENPAGYCGDLTLDGKVNLADYAELSANWQSGYSMDTLLHIINDWLSGLEEYQLTVNSGTGSGDYTAGTVVSISADAPPTGYEFAGWAGDVAYVADAGDPTTTVTMPTKNIDLTATYSVQETTISWQPAVAVFSASDVSTDGILVEAVNACGDAIAAAGFTENPIVNGVQFMADPDLLDGNHSTSDFCTSLPEGEYDQLVSTLDYFGSPTSIEVGHDLLEVGVDYMIQIWYVDERPNYDSRTMQYADEDGGDPSGAVNDQYVIGTFTADGATLFIAITATGTDDPHINAYQIRKLSE